MRILAASRIHPESTWQVHISTPTLIVRGYRGANEKHIPIYCYTHRRRRKNGCVCVCTHALSPSPTHTQTPFHQIGTLIIRRSRVLRLKMLPTDSIADIPRESHHASVTGELEPTPHGCTCPIRGRKANENTIFMRENTGLCLHTHARRRMIDGDRGAISMTEMVCVCVRVLVLLGINECAREHSCISLLSHVGMAAPRLMVGAQSVNLNATENLTNVASS